MQCLPCQRLRHLREVLAVVGKLRAIKSSKRNNTKALRSFTRNDEINRSYLLLIFVLLMWWRGRSETPEECHKYIPRDRAMPLPNILPIHYVHIPKTGSSIAAAIVGHACPGLQFERGMAVMEPSNFFEYYARDIAKGACLGGFSRFQGGHDPLEARVRESYPHNVVMMMRDPYERVWCNCMHY
jgi:hypothetical protein